MADKPSAFEHVKKPKLARRRAAAGPFAGMTFLKAAKYGYSNARVSAMKSLLLKKPLLLEIARAGSVDAVIELLERTYYKENLVKFSMHHHGSDLVQVASALHFAEIANRLERITPEADRATFAIMLTKWDVVNAKAILNARRIGKRYEDVAPFLIPIGSFSEDEVKGLLSTSGESIFLKFARTNLGRGMISSMVASSTELEKLFMTLGPAELAKLDALLDAFQYSLYTSGDIASSRELEPIAKVFKREIDAKNACIIVRLKQHGITDSAALQRYFIKGGGRSFASFAQLAEAKGMEEMLKVAASQMGLKKVPASASELETLLGNEIAKLRLQAFYRSVLSLGTIMGFLFLKEEEINNLRKIAVGKEFGVPEARIGEMLVFPD